MELSVDLIIKIAGIGIVVAIAEQLLNKADKSEYSLLVTLIGLVIVLTFLVPEISGLFDLLRSTFDI